MRAIYIMMLVVGLLSCSSKPPEPAQTAKPERDLRSYTLDPQTKEAAPYMQEHLYKLVALNSPIAFPVKPEFAFLDQDEDKRGSLNPIITRMNLIHMALWDGDQHLWSGSIMHGVGRGWMGVTRAGRVFKVAVKDGDLTVSLTEGDDKVAVTLKEDQPRDGWYNFGSRRLYLNYYTFPEDHVKRKP